SPRSRRSAPATAFPRRGRRPVACGRAVAHRGRGARVAGARHPAAGHRRRHRDAGRQTSADPPASLRTGSRSAGDHGARGAQPAPVGRPPHARDQGVRPGAGSYPHQLGLRTDEATPAVQPRRAPRPWSRAGEGSRRRLRRLRGLRARCAVRAGHAASAGGDRGLALRRRGAPRPCPSPRRHGAERRPRRLDAGRSGAHRGSQAGGDDNRSGDRRLRDGHRRSVPWDRDGSRGGHEGVTADSAGSRAGPGRPRDARPGADPRGTRDGSCPGQGGADGRRLGWGSRSATVAKPRRSPPEAARRRCAGARAAL
ncbi:MAG: hypothetical protein AVDCRST_MAG69-1073, partial [uncultured Solirubrobacteraceae bacterium]